MLFPVLKGRHRRRLRSRTQQQVASVKDNDVVTTNYYDKPAKITRTAIPMSFYSTLLATILILSEQFTRSTCLIAKHGSPYRSRSQFRYSNHQQYHRFEHQVGRSFSEINQKHTNRDPVNQLRSCKIRARALQPGKTIGKTCDIDH